jgi:hypothetical protein
LDRLHLPTLPVTVARALIFILFFANAGVAYVLAAQAATYNVRFIYFCSATQCSTNDSYSELNTYAGQIQTWYGQKTGKTFTRLSTIKITGSYASSHYNGGSYNSNNTYYSVYDELATKKDSYGTPYINSTTKTVVLLGFHSMANCGLGGGAMAIVDPASNSWCAAHIPSSLAHELGHTLLNSSTSDHTYNSDYNLMHADDACNSAALSSCTLYSSQKTTILSRPWLNTTYSGSTTTTTTTSTSSPYNESGISTYSCTMVPHTTVNKGDTGNCVKHLQWILVHKKGYNLGTYGPNGDGVDGSFGSATDSAVRNFQSKNGLTTDGVVGPKTWDKLH